MADPKKKKHSMHGAMGALLDELDRTGAVSPPNLVSPTTKEAEKRFVEETPAKPVDSTMPSLGPKGRGDTLPYTRSNEQLVKIPAARVQPWYLRNRQEPDMGDMQDLIDSIATDGQAIPILIRPVRGQHAEGITHEVYAGYRRWTACKELNIDVLAIIRDVDDQEAAIIQETENEDREQISPASRAFHYKTLLEQHIFPSETALATSLHLHRSTLNDLLSYTRLDPALAEAIGDLHVLPLRFAKVLATLCREPGNLHLLVQLGPEIATGAVTTRNIEQRLEQLRTGIKPDYSLRTIKGKDGQDLLKVRYDSNGTPVISVLQAAREKSSMDDLLSYLTAFFDKPH
jgi:ParB family chromosome partitioning protein